MSKNKEDFAVFNLIIERIETDSRLRKYDTTSDFIGEFVLLGSGELIRGSSPYLHTYRTELGFCDDHIHLGPGNMNKVLINLMRDNEGHLYLDAKYETPHFTLDGARLMSLNKSNRLKVLEGIIRQHNPGFRLNSIATREDTRLKLLENAYKRYVSDQ